jgi:hypothetical protein
MNTPSYPISSGEGQMRDSRKADRRLGEHMLRALNKIRKPSTAEEITELLNRDLDPGDRPFQARDVMAWLQNSEHNEADPKFSL